MQIATCRPYHAQTVGQSLLRMPDVGNGAGHLFPAKYTIRGEGLQGFLRAAQPHDVMRCCLG